MDPDAEREQLLINSPSKPSSVKCDIANECQMFLNAEDGGGDAHTNMNRSATNDTGKSNFYYPSFYPTKVFLPGDIIDDSNPEHVEANEIQNESTSKAQEPDNYLLSTQNQSTSKTQESDDSLPSTVTVLDAPDGGKVYLVGTAHFSLESQEDVSKVIQKVCPHMVMVELCEQRTNILLLDEDVILSEAKNINIAKIRASIAQNGVFNGLMYILLLNMTAHITTELGMAPGGEFRRAMAEVSPLLTQIIYIHLPMLQSAKKIPNCIVQLGDRSINITLQRAISALSWGQTIRFIWHLLTSNQNISLEEVERCKQKKLLEDMLEEMAEEFPALKHVFVVERDMYLCHSLQVAAMQPRREPCRIVGVVGIGHVAGIVEHWGKIETQDISPLLQIPPPSLSTRVLRVSARAAAAGALLYALYRLVPRRWLL